MSLAGTLLFYPCDSGDNNEVEETFNIIQNLCIRERVLCAVYVGMTVPALTMLACHLSTTDDTAGLDSCMPPSAKKVSG